MCKLLAYRITVRNSGALRPFFIVTGESALRYERKFEVSVGTPTSLSIAVTAPGNGVQWPDYTFSFSENGPWLRSLSDGARRVKTKVKTFNPAGRLLKTAVLDEN